MQRGINLTYLGDASSAVPWIERAMRLDPFSADHYYLDLVRALFMSDRATEAVAILEQMDPSRWEHYVLLAACRMTIGDATGAGNAAAQALSARPQLTIEQYLNGWFAWKRAEDRARLHDALKLSGLPEGKAK